VIGPILGGFITDSFSWHWIFYINIPLGIITIVLFIFFFPQFRLDSRKHRVDYAGMMALVLAVVPLLLALSWGGTEYPWLSVPIIGMFTLSAASIIAVLIIEAKSEEAIVPLRIFKNPVVTISIVITFLSGIGMFGSIIFIPLFFQGVLGLSATTSGSFLTPMMLCQVFASFISGQLLARTGGHYRLQGIFGLAIMAAGLMLISRVTPATSYISALVDIGLIGFGLGIIMPIYTIAVQNTVPYNFLGAATSLVPFFRAIGGTVGLSIFGSIMSNRLASEFITKLPEAIKTLIPPELLSSITHNAQVLVSPEAQAQLQAVFSGMGEQGAALYDQTLQTLREALNAGLRQIFVVAFVIIVLAFITNLFLREIPLRKQHMLDESGGN
jgi:EmrB/QacA subfamily drug resistance transporter